MVKNIKAIFLDAVGTLIEPSEPVSNTYHRFAKLFDIPSCENDLKLSFKKAFLKQEELDLSNSLQTNEPRELERWETIVADCFGPHPRLADCFKELYAWYSKPVAWKFAEGAFELLEKIRSLNLPWGLASNFDGRLRNLHSLFGAKNQPQWWIISSEIGWRKPSPRFFERVTASSGLDSWQVLFAGDDPTNDIEPANQSGFQTYQVRKGSAKDEAGSLHFLADYLGK